MCVCAMYACMCVYVCVRGVGGLRSEGETRPTLDYQIKHGVWRLVHAKNHIRVICARFLCSGYSFAPDTLCNPFFILSVDSDY